MSTNHPDWLAVGQTVRLRRTNLTERVTFHEAKVVVTRHTKASVFVAYPASPTDEKRFVRKGERYHETPRYLDQPTILEPLDKADA